MHPPRIPDDDARRVALLQAARLLDTGAEERFDRITRAASALLDVPIALVNLVDDRRQWAKSAVGFEQGAEADRSISFCAHVVGDGGPVRVPEVRDDPRFVDNPMVTDDPPALRSYYGTPVRGPEGAIFGTLCVADHEPRDLSDAQLQLLDDLGKWVEAEFERGAFAESMLIESGERQRIQAIADAVADGILVLDRSGTVLLANPAAELLADQPDGGLLGRSLAELLVTDPDTRDELLALVATGELTGTRRFDLDVRRRDGSPRQLEVHVSALPDEDAFVAVARDVSAQRQLERMKDEFVATASHELRTPLTSMKGTLEIVTAGLVGELPAEATGLLQVARGNTERLIRLVNDILDVERLSSGRLELQRGPADLATLVGDAVGTIEVLARDADVRLEVAVDPTPVEVDGDRIVQAVMNLLGNAVKFAPAGSTVEVTTAREGERVRLTVRDHGRGVPPEDLERIFDRFAQVEVADATRKGGSGLGLPIARGLVEGHGGRLWAESVLGEGASFHLELPVAA